MKKIKRVDLVKQWKKERSRLLPLIIQSFESGEYIGSEEIEKLEKKNC